MAGTVADTFPVRPGSIGLDNTLRQDTALYLKMFSGEVLGTFLKKNKFLNLTRSMNVGVGKSHQFPAIGETTAKYHVRGDNIWANDNGYITDVEHDEKIIYVDKTLLSAVAIDNWDDLIKHYETRSEYTLQLGEALADKLDRQIIQSIIRGSRSALTPANLPVTQPDKVGKEITAATADTASGAVIDAMIEGATHLVEQNCPMDEITFAVRPAMYYALASDPILIDRDMNPENGSPAEGKILKGYGFNIIWTNNMPERGGPVVTQADGEFNDYSGTFNTVEAFGFHRSAVATVYRQGVVTETEKSVARQAELLVSKMVCGTGVLRPECCVSVKTA